MIGEEMDGDSGPKMANSCQSLEGCWSKTYSNRDSVCMTSKMVPLACRQFITSERGQLCFYGLFSDLESERFQINI